MLSPGHLQLVPHAIFHTVNRLLEESLVPIAGCLIVRNVTMGNKPAPGASINLIQSIPPVFTHVGIIMGARAALPTFVLNAEKASI